MAVTSCTLPIFTSDNVAMKDLGFLELGELVALLRDEGLPCENLGTDRQCRFFSFRSADGAAIGFSGLELFGTDALLRSVVVVKTFRGRGCGRIIITKTLKRARELGVRHVYLLTTTAMTFFRQLGFSNVKREDAPETIAKSEEFSVLCPTSAMLMKSTLR
jgi:N-acetylglutamate synthase-like GNAT family acetyltransferase